MTLGCDEFPESVGDLQMDDCVDNEFVHYCTNRDNGDLVCLEARNLAETTTMEEGGKTWVPGGFGRPAGGDIQDVSIGGAGIMGFTEDEIVREMKQLGRSFSNEGMLDEVSEEMRERQRERDAR